MKRTAPQGNKIKELEKIRDSLKSACKRSGAFKGAVVVFGDGPEESRVMVVGEAPGREETRLKKPFVGKAGRFLISVLKEVFKKEREYFYITNVVKVWPVTETRRLKTRKPTREEEEFFLPYLKKEISAVRPAALLAVGKTAFCALAPDKEFKPGVWVEGADRPLIMPVYHPSYILRRGSMIKENTGELKAALRKVKRRLGL